jgi:hypothetical protein
MPKPIAQSALLGTLATARSNARSRSGGPSRLDPTGVGVYNGELKQLMLRHAFRCVDTVVFFVGPDNIRSQRSFEKIGAVRQREPDGQGRVIYRIHASAFVVPSRPPNQAMRTRGWGNEGTSANSANSRVPHEVVAGLPNQRRAADARRRRAPLTASVSFIVQSWVESATSKRRRDET